MKVKVQEARKVSHPDELGNVRKDILVRLRNKSELLPGAQLDFRGQLWKRNSRRLLLHEVPEHNPCQEVRGRSESSGAVRVSACRFFALDGATLVASDGMGCVPKWVKGRCAENRSQLKTRTHD